MEEFDKKLLAIYGSVIFFISLFVFHVLFSGFLLLTSTTNRFTGEYINTFYIIIGIMCVGYILFLSIIMFLVFKGREKDLRFESIRKYIEWSLR
ncbi:MAG: hypothetical protein JSW73_05375 [Candidatus Woesearchaeota archaeon]|nr:MAG: hypothetical protein JSW73_05375 [Candidatus Woesearchaeota archaeon]